MLNAIEWRTDGLYLLDQTRLPGETHFLHCTTLNQICDAIVRLAVRGAPAIGIAAAYGVVVGLQESGADPRSCYDTIERALAATRPTAVNLFWALRRMRQTFAACASAPECLETLLQEAKAIHQEDIAMNRAIGRNGAELLGSPCRVLTHCNAGALATGGYGTALGVIRAAVEAGKQVEVFADETRPLLQGARLTAYELAEDGIPVTLICDNMAAALMRDRRIDAVIVGSDRTVANGDVANKIGTYGLAILAHHHQVPFYAAMPSSTIDLSIPTGAGIPIEERKTEEVRGYGSCLWAAEVPVWNPAFDVTPHELVTAIITEKGVIAPPFDINLPKILGR